MTNQEINRRFAEMCGLCWHIYGYDPNDRFLRVPQCPKCQIHLSANFPNPDFISDPRLVLREMMKLKDWPVFIAWYNGSQYGEPIRRHVMNLAAEGKITEVFIGIRDILDTTGLLVKAGIEWLEKEANL